jgi:hypothetical protein
MNKKFVILRKKAGFQTRYQASVDSGVTEAHLRQIEMGRIRSLQGKTAVRIANSFNLTLDELDKAIPVQDVDYFEAYINRVYGA